MIGWKVDVGYLDSLNPSTLSEIHWTDKNKYFCFPTVSADLQSSEVEGDGNHCYSLLYNSIGNDIFTAYAVPPREGEKGIADLYNEVTYWVPSIVKMYPNLWSYYNTRSETEFIELVYAYYFPSLNRVVVTTGTSGKVGFVSPNGRISFKSSLLTNLFYFGFGATGSRSGDNFGVGFSLPSIAGYKEGMDLSDYKIWVGYSLGYNTLYGKYRARISRYNFYPELPLNEDVIQFIKDLFENNNVSPDVNIINPYEPGGDSGPGDTPPGTFDDISDPIPDSSLPSISAANTGFTRIYNPTLSQVQDLARYLWTDDSVLQTIWNKLKQFFEDPMQAIIGFNLVPCAVPNGGTEDFTLMYIPTGVNMTVAATQFVDVDCGTVQLERYYGSALDQSPYTKVSCFLPYIGTVQLDTDEVMGTTLQVKYRIDIVSGSCVAKILVDGSVIYQYSGHCAINIPISSADFSSYVSALISVASLAVGAASGAVAGLPITQSAAAQQTGQTLTTTKTITNTVRNPATGRQVTSGTRTVTTTQEVPQSHTKAAFDFLSPANIANTAGEIMTSKPNVEHSGSFSGNSGYLGVRRPFLIIERPRMCLPAQYQKFNGYPAMISMQLSACKGYTRIQQIQLTGLSATNPEQDEILGLLKSGVIF